MPDLEVDLVDADDNTLAYLSLILPCLLPRPHRKTSIWVEVRSGWTASTHAWHTLEETLLSLPRGEEMQVSLQLYYYAAIPTRETLPDECMDIVAKEMLPRCVSHNLLVGRCSDNFHCPLHNAKR